MTNISQSHLTGEITPFPHQQVPSRIIEEEPLSTSFLDLGQTLSENSQTPLRVRPLSVDVIRGWFRQLITAKAIGQDDSKGGFLENIPLNPGDTFPASQQSIYLVFTLTTPPADAKQITTQWVAEQVERHPPNTVMGTDTVLVGLNDSTGYFFLDQPEGGWAVGTYRIDLFVGEEVSPYTYVADVRFRIQS
ncbi:MAG TPA: hypothetical protein DD706_08110, partial [Nitrospiraceae bacterium]|nr:hypothetical protein [Nitrospiraceae bacterium]